MFLIENEVFTIHRGLIHRRASKFSTIHKTSISMVAGTHMLRLERVQYRRIRIGQGLMCLTPKNSLGVLSVIAPLAERSVYLNLRFLVAVICRLDHPFMKRLETLSGLNLGRCIAGYSNATDYSLI
jgi:hypothetical protein